MGQGIDDMTVREFARVLFVIHESTQPGNGSKLNATLAVEMAHHIKAPKGEQHGTGDKAE